LAHIASRPSVTELQSQVNAAMAQFAELEAQRIQEEMDQLNQPDADGFITVRRTRGRKLNKDAQGGKVYAIKADEAAKLKPKEKGLVDFYRFQMRETKRNRILTNAELHELRQKFEQDKKRISEMREKRKFKPY
jgi:ribosomal RNA-processing protein 7